MFFRNTFYINTLASTFSCFKRLADVPCFAFPSRYRLSGETAREVNAKQHISVKCVCNEATWSVCGHQGNAMPLRGYDRANEMLKRRSMGPFDRTNTFHLLMKSHQRQLNVSFS